MEYDRKKREIKLDRRLSNLDKFVLDFVKVLKKHVDYVIVSGYVSILLGRSRATEDVDLLVPEISLEKFKNLFNELSSKGYGCVNTMDIDEAYDMLKDFAIRFFEKGHPTPNIEFKIIKTGLDRYSFENRIKVILKEKMLFISPLEVQIAYKLFLAADGNDKELFSDKDIEDAKYIYELFKEKINKEEMSLFIDRLNVKDKIKWLEK